MGRELDVRVAKALGETVCECGDDALAETRIDGQWICARCGRHFSKHRSTDIAEAMKLERLMPHFELRRITADWWQCKSAFCGDPMSHLVASFRDGIVVYSCGCKDAEADTPAEAICEAFVAWKESDHDRE